MRRLLFNPLEQEPYTSGEYNINEQKFILDKPLEANHIYYAIVYSDARLASFGPAFFDFRCKEFNQSIAVSSIPLLDGFDDTYIFGLRASTDYNFIEVVHPTITPSTSDEGLVIYIYQLM